MTRIALVTCSSFRGRPASPTPSPPPPPESAAIPLGAKQSRVTEPVFDRLPRARHLSGTAATTRLTRILILGKMCPTIDICAGEAGRSAGAAAAARRWGRSLRHSWLFLASRRQATVEPLIDLII